MEPDIRRRREVLAILMVLIVTGIFFLMMGWNEFFQSRTFLDGAKRTQGVVIELVYERGSGGRAGSSSGYRSVYRYTALDGETHTNRSRSRSDPPRHAVGDPLAVRYRPEQPDNARIDSFAELWSSATWNSGFGLFLLGIGTIGLLTAIKHRAV